MWFDAHSHLHDARLGDPQPVVAAMRRAGVIRCVVNSTRESDWPVVASLSEQHPDLVLPAFGIHPWHADTAGDGWQDRLRDLLEKHPNSSIGEVGLDKWVDSPSIDIQMLIFLDQIRIAREIDRPLTIHCLKAWGPLVETLAASAPPRFLLHSFSGSLETARRLIPLASYFSCSGYFLHPRKAAALDVFRHLPPDRILLETDAPDMTPPGNFVTYPLADPHNHPANLQAIGNALAEALGHNPDAFADLTRANATRFFGA